MRSLESITRASPGGNHIEADLVRNGVTCTASYSEWSRMGETFHLDAPIIMSESMWILGKEITVRPRGILTVEIS